MALRCCGALRVAGSESDGLAKPEAEGQPEGTLDAEAEAEEEEEPDKEAEPAAEDDGLPLRENIALLLGPPLPRVERVVAAEDEGLREGSGDSLAALLLLLLPLGAGEREGAAEREGEPLGRGEPEPPKTPVCVA